MGHAFARCLPLFCWLGVVCSAYGQTPTDPSNYSRTTAYAYNADGTLQATTVEPDNPQSCHATTLGYDARGNVNSSSLANCASASSTPSLQFAPRPSSAAFDPVTSQGITTGGSLTPNVFVSIPAGLVQTSSKNALSQQTLFESDPRFGTTTKTTDIDQRVSKVIFDDFGRPIKSIKPDGTSVRSFYCILAGTGLDASSNSASCAAPSAPEVPVYAVRFAQTEPHDTSDAKMGSFVRVYYDRLGRAIRTATESFDGTSQPAVARGALVVTDTVYDTDGAKVLETRPYFLASGSTTVNGSGDVGVVMHVYDALGRGTLDYASDPDATSGLQQTFGGTGAVGYGVYGTRRVATTSYSFIGITTTTTNDLGEQRVEEHDARGAAVRVTDSNGAQLAFLHDAFSNVIRVVDALQNTITTAYDIQGAKTQLNDPDHGVIVYCFDALGQLKAQQTSAMRGNDTPQACPTNLNSSTNAVATAGWTTVAYDTLGRMTQRAEPESVATWNFDNCANGVGELCQASTSLGSTKTYVYDNVGRLIDTRLDVASGPSFASAVAFDATTGRLASKTYPSGLQVGYIYTSRGFAQELVLNTAATVNPLPDAQGHVASSVALGAFPATSSVLWSANTVDATSSWESQAFGNGVVEAVSQNPSNGRIWARTASLAGSASVVNQSYTWDGVDNVKTRTDNIGNGQGAVTELFGYDALNRLSAYSVSSPGIPNLERDIALQYNALGMLLGKTDVGNYTYGNSGTRHVHALASTDGSGASYGVDLNGNVLTATTGKYQQMTYTSFDNVQTAQGGGSSYGWLYDEAHARQQETRTSAGNTRVTWYLHPDNAGALGFEVEKNSSPASQSNRHFLTVNGNVIGVLVTAGALPTLSTGQAVPPAPSGALIFVKVEYWHKDHLGSLAATTDHLGTVTDRYAYDPFGKRRYTDGRYDATGLVVADWSPSVNYGSARGFTGHEQLDDIGIVNMNGRLYDATLGLFMQADPMVTNPNNLQNYNRYAYLLNNPLNGTDPTGFAGTNGENDSGGNPFYTWLQNLFGSSNTNAGSTAGANSGDSNNTSNGNPTAKDGSGSSDRPLCTGYPCMPHIGKQYKKAAVPPAKAMNSPGGPFQDATPKELAYSVGGAAAGAVIGAGVFFGGPPAWAAAGEAGTAAVTVVLVNPVTTTAVVTTVTGEGLAIIQGATSPTSTAGMVTTEARVAAKAVATTTEAVVGAEAKAAKIDFVVSRDGAVVHSSPEEVRASLDGAGLQGKSVANAAGTEAGTIHNIPEKKMDARVMNGGPNHPPRVVVSRQGTSQPVNPANGANFGNVPKIEQRERSHIVFP